MFIGIVDYKKKDWTKEKCSCRKGRFCRDMGCDSCGIRIPAETETYMLHHYEDDEYIGTYILCDRCFETDTEIRDFGEWYKD